MPGARTITKSLEDALRTTPLFGEIPPGAIQELAEQGRVRDYRRGTYFFHQHDEAKHVFFLWKGRVEISSTSVTGHRQLHTTLVPPDFFGEFGILGEIPRTATAIALEDSTVLVIPGETFVRFIIDHRQSARAMLRALARQIAAHEVLVEDLLFLDLKGRVAKRLLGLVTPAPEEMPPNGSRLPSDVTHADLAALVGGSRENITRILSDFQRRGLVERDGRRYVLTDVARLRRLAGL